MRGPAVTIDRHCDWRDRRPLLSRRGTRRGTGDARPSGRTDDRCPIRRPEQWNLCWARTIRAERGRDCRAWHGPGHQGSHVACSWDSSGSRHSGPHRSSEYRRFRRLSLCRAGPCVTPYPAQAQRDPARAKCCPGRANRFLAARADVLALSFASTELVPGKVPTAVIGNPVRPAIGELAQTSYTAPSDRIRLLVLGGSLGARVFSDVVPAALKSLPEGLRSRVTVIQQCRAEDWVRVRDAYAEFGMEAELSPFFPNVAGRLAAAHLVIARAGASTLAELAVAGRPAILVPLPGAIDDHQSANARALAAAGGAWVMPQPQFDPVSLAQRLSGLLTDPAALTAAAVAAHSQGRVDAAARLAELVESHLRQDTVRLGESA